jgi:hypothetical protein
MCLKLNQPTGKEQPVSSKSSNRSCAKRVFQ